MSNALITVIATAYKETTEVHTLLASLVNQTDPRWKCFVFMDCENPYIEQAIRSYNDSRFVCVKPEKHSGFWGHYNRKIGLDKYADTKYVLQASVQDYYIPTAFSKILLSNADFIFFNCLHNHMNHEILDTFPVRNRMDWGTMVVKTQLAKNTGINHPESPICDGLFAEECMRNNPLVTKLSDILLVHN